MSKRFRIAFSFAGEKRHFVAEVAAILAARFGEEAILYDEYHKAEFARRDLALYLPELYYHESDLIVVVVCPNYEKKEWFGLEWVSIHDLLKRQKRDEVMLTRFDHAVIVGLYSTAGYVELDGKSPEQTATLIIERLALNEGRPKDYYTLPGATTPSKPTLNIPNNLPRLPFFVGREMELRAIADALAPEARTWGVLIDGPGGIGKTSLAIRAAELASPGQFSRILFLSANDREMSPEGERKGGGFVLPGYLEMLNEIARLLQKPELTKVPEIERTRYIIETLESEHALLILDNIESLTFAHRDQLFALLSRLPQGCKAIVISRRRTDVDARIIRLENLDQSAALLYIAELAEGRPLLARTSELDRLHLYEETGGNPLLLRWIAGQLGQGRCRTIASALELLSNAPAGNDPLEFIFGDVVETFTEDEIRILSTLTHFSSAMGARVIAELSGVSNAAAQSALEVLSSRAVVVPDATEENFSLVPMVANFFRRKRPEAVQEAGDRLAEYSFALIMENGYSEHDRFPVLDAAWPSIASALHLFLAGPNERLQTVCDGLQVFLNFVGRWDELLLLNQRAETRAVEAGDYTNAGWRAYQEGWVHYQQEHANDVLDCAERANEHWSVAQAGARERFAAIRLRGMGHELARNYPAAIAAYRESLDLRRSLSPESSDVAIALNDLADVERASGDLEAAERDYQAALRVAHTVGAVHGVVVVTSNLADLALDRLEWQRAEAIAREAQQLSERLGIQELVGANCLRLAKALVRQGKNTEALPHAQRAMEIFVRLGSPNLSSAREILTECET